MTLWAASPWRLGHENILIPTRRRDLSLQLLQGGMGCPIALTSSSAQTAE